jgi:hypothetical protein
MITAMWGAIIIIILVVKECALFAGNKIRIRLGNAD